MKPCCEIERKETSRTKDGGGVEHRLADLGRPEFATRSNVGKSDGQANVGSENDGRGQPSHRSASCYFPSPLCASSFLLFSLCSSVQSLGSLNYRTTRYPYFLLYLLPLRKASVYVQRTRTTCFLYHTCITIFSASKHLGSALLCSVVIGLSIGSGQWIIEH
ncbi:hypothetical protein FB451DRAFT_755490 [Mycena latifolia]|nr:hypothetical protein FB451DRAFT_755490 [Mycena latifolia]